jgi:hypothetical protein
LGEGDAPFFGVPKKEKRGERQKRTPFFAVGGFVGRGCQRGGLAEFWERTEDKPTTVRESKTVVHVVTKTVAKVVGKPYIHPSHTS